MNQRLALKVGRAASPTTTSRSWSSSTLLNVNGVELGQGAGPARRSSTSRDGLARRSTSSRDSAAVAFARRDQASRSARRDPRAPGPIRPDPTLRAHLEWRKCRACDWFRRSAGPSTITGDRTLLGRDPSADLVVNDPSVSRRHALIERRTEGWVVLDQRSANGTFLDNQRVEQAAAPVGGQQLRLGAVSFEVRLPGTKPRNAAASLLDAPGRACSGPGLRAASGSASARAGPSPGPLPGGSRRAVVRTAHSRRAQGRPARRLQRPPRPEP